MKKTVIEYEKAVESIDAEKIILDSMGKYPRKIILRGKGGFEKEYRLVRTQSGNLILNK